MYHFNHFKMKPLKEKFNLLLLLSTTKTTSPFQMTEASVAWSEMVWNRVPSCLVMSI